MEKYECNKCGKEFNSERSLAQHKRDYDHSKLEDDAEKFPLSLPSPNFNFRQFYSGHRKLVRLAGVFVLVGVASAIFLFPNWGTSVPEEEIVSRNGLHSHARLDIEIMGDQVDIPINVGIGVTEKPIHTHTERNRLHLEFSGQVRKSDIQLSKFFEIWGKRFNEECIFDRCNGSQGQLKMFVNGERNYEYGNYLMQDGDNIELVFE